MSDTCRKNKLSGYWKSSVTVSYQATTGTSTTQPALIVVHRWKVLYSINEYLKHSSSDAYP
jgi:hypothetical protein